MKNILSFMTLEQIKTHQFPKQKQKEQVKPLRTHNVNADGTVITLENLKDYDWDKDKPNGIKE
jgi:hypothetical protein